MRNKIRIYWRTCKDCKRFFYTLARWGKKCSKCNKARNKKVYEVDINGKTKNRK